MLGERHDIHVALDHDDPAGGADGSTRLEQTVELPTLGE